MRSNTDAAPRFQREKHFPQGWEPCVEQFVSLFHRFAYIYKPIGGGSWLSADERWKLTDTEILKAIACAHPKFYIGARAGRASRFAVIDIDSNSKYHNQKALRKLIRLLSNAGLGRCSLYRSSFSGGWHLYLFFDEPISSKELRQQLTTFLALNDFTVAKGTLEVFPHASESSNGLGLRLPLQPGFAWLEKDTLEVEHERAELTATQALELFVDALDGDANAYADFRRFKEHVAQLKNSRALSRERGQLGVDNVVSFRRQPESVGSGEFVDFVKGVFGKLPPGILSENWYRGRLYHLSGLTAPSQRADAITCLGHYLFYGDPSRNLPALGYGYEDEREWAIKEFLELHHNGQSKDISRGRSDALAQVERAAQWMPAHKKGAEPIKYTGEVPVIWVKANAKREAAARKRIAEALEALSKVGRAFTTVELQETAGCSRRTLYDHQDIWRQRYEELKENRFAICTGEYNAVEGAASPESLPPSTAAAKIAPPGLLAARRIIYEMNLRSERQKRNKHKEAVRAREASENKWRGEVDRLTGKPPSDLPVERQKALLSVLYGYRSLAPTEEDLNFVQSYIQQILHSLSAATEAAIRIVDST